MSKKIVLKLHKPTEKLPKNNGEYIGFFYHKNLCNKEILRFRDGKFYLGDPNTIFSAEIVPDFWAEEENEQSLD